VATGRTDGEGTSAGAGAGGAVLTPEGAIAGASCCASAAAASAAVVGGAAPGRVTRLRSCMSAYEMCVCRVRKRERERRVKEKDMRREDRKKRSTYDTGGKAHRI
jgi:hypothetical protein